jgi:hypothetical protein
MSSKVVSATGRKIVEPGMSEVGMLKGNMVG